MKNSQLKEILKILMSGNSLTSYEAFIKLGCTRLPAQIHHLRSKGYVICTKMESGPTRFGGVTTYAVYSMPKSND